ncbi:MAG: phospholipase A [Verrucomicrobiota bacterium]|jgi:outer membrane phospholipase A
MKIRRHRRFRLWAGVVFLLALASFARRQDGNHESLQLDLTYPTMRLFGSFSLYLDVQYFTGYGESLLGYNKKSDELRAGFSLFR